MEQLTEKQRTIVASLKEHFAGIHPVLFQRMVNRAKDESELFDILDTIPESFPLVWDMDKRRLTRATNILKK